MRSEEHTSELQSLMRISYAVLCLKKKKKIQKQSQAPHHSKPPRETRLRHHVRPLTCTTTTANPTTTKTSSLYIYRNYILVITSCQRIHTNQRHKTASRIPT